MGRGKFDTSADYFVCSHTARVDVNEDSWLCWTNLHDYNPHWDYEVLSDYRYHPLLLLAQNIADEICKVHTKSLSFENVRVFPVILESGLLAKYIDGTCAAPVIVLDIDNHTSANHLIGEFEKAEINRSFECSILHELRHACQESMGVEYDELEAERGSGRIPF